MGKTGWWRQIQSGEYPETKTDYGSASAANWKPDCTQHSSQPIKVQKKQTLTCPHCGKTYWSNKGCSNCRYSNAIQNLKIKKQPDRKPSVSKLPIKGLPIRKPSVVKFTDIAINLLRRYGKFYRSLESGSRIPTTLAQRRFVLVCQGRVKPNAIHERTYLKYIKHRFSRSS